MRHRALRGLLRRRVVLEFGHEPAEQRAAPGGVWPPRQAEAISSIARPTIAGSAVRGVAISRPGVPVGTGGSRPWNSSSYSFSPGRRPVKRISTSLVGPQPGQPDHLAREIDDLHRLAHVEHEDAAVAAPLASRAAPTTLACSTSPTASRTVMK